MIPNYSKLAFGATLENNPLANDCHNYGILSGCDEGCPTLLSGGCDVPEEAIACSDFDDEQKEEVMALYNLVNCPQSEDTNK